MSTSRRSESISWSIDSRRPPSLTSIDFQIREVGGIDTSTLLLQELPLKETPPVSERKEELDRQIQRLKNELAYRTQLINEVRLHILPMVQLHSEGLRKALDDCTAEIKRLSKPWER